MLHTTLRDDAEGDVTDRILHPEKSKNIYLLSFFVAQNKTDGKSLKEYLVLFVTQFEHLDSFLQASCFSYV